MAGFLKKNSRVLLSTLVIFISIILAACSVVLLESFSEEMQSQATLKVELNAQKLSSQIKLKVERYEAKASMAAQLVKKAKTNVDFFESVYRLTENEEFEDLKFARYFKDGDIYYYGSIYAHESSEIMALAGHDSIETSAPFFETEYGMYMLAVYCPIKDCDFADGIVLYYPVSTLYTIDIDKDNEVVEQADLFVFCSRNGEIYKVFSGTGVFEHSNLFTYIGEKANDLQFKSKVSSLIIEGKSEIIEFQIDLVPYILAIENVSENGGEYSIVCMYQSEYAYSSGYIFVNAILGTLIVFFVVFIGFAAFSIVHQRRVNKTLEEVGMTDKKYNCLTEAGFERDLPHILNNNKATKFTVVSAEIRNFKFYEETLGENAVEGVINYVLMIFQKAMQIEEQYAYTGRGQFLLLLHYKDIDNAVGRLKIMNALLNKYTGLSSNRSYTPSLVFGVYEVDRNLTVKPHQYVEYAVEARNNKQAGETESYRFYSEQEHQEKVEITNIELKMHGAIANKEFRIFYQPKYNINKNTIDGSEALVRWYDPEKDVYHSPGLFMPLFEANGFVNKLDRYVYENVCAYLQECFANKQRVYPVSVNVSRVTASQPDFLDYYIGIKNNYGIPNGYLTIEFTESFAYEDYDTLRVIIERLHKNGFKCSIDDFGVGYSSYNTLKQLSMDEIKLDMFFIKSGIAVERDDAIISSIAKLAKDNEDVANR
ncbi:MAG: EAL domain-containing protein, partial [Clostridia bacterium]|nr:EAL domain-containing protein [Clostridia bacterium]